MDTYIADLSDNKYDINAISKFIGRNAIIQHDGNEHMCTKLDIPVIIEDDGAISLDLPVKTDENGNLFVSQNIEYSRSTIRNITKGHPYKSTHSIGTDRNDIPTRIDRNTISSQLWNMRLNKDIIKNENDASLIVKDRFKNKPVVILGASPFLKNHKDIWIDLINRNVIDVIAINGALIDVPNAQYFTTIDWQGKDIWFKNADVSKIHAILFAGASNKIAKMNWKAKSFYNIEQGCLQLARSYKINPNLPMLISGLGSIHSITHCAYLWGCNAIIYDGVSGTIKNGLHSYDKEVKFDKFTEMTYGHIVNILEALCHFICETGVEIYNCSLNTVFGTVDTFTDKVNLCKIEDIVNRYDTITL